MKTGYMDEIFHESEFNNSKMINQLLDQFFRQVKNTDENTKKFGKALATAVIVFFGNI